MQNEIVLRGFSDSDWGSGHDRKSVSGYCFTLQENGAIVSWQTRKQSVVALSTCEAAYVAVTYAIQESLFLKQLVCDMLDLRNLKIVIGVDNQSAIKLSKNPASHQRTKHIDIKYHFIRDIISKGLVELHYIQSQDNIADLFTKPLS